MDIRLAEEMLNQVDNDLCARVRSVFAEGEGTIGSRMATLCMLMAEICMGSNGADKEEALRDLQMNFEFAQLLIQYAERPQ